MSMVAYADGPFTSASEVMDLVSRFEACTIASAEWNHRAHLTVALCYSALLRPDEALAAMRLGIHRLNAASGVESTSTSGYHETMTRAYMLIVGNFIELEGRSADLGVLANRLYERYGERDLLLRYYSRDRLMSPAARTGWEEPDLHRLP